MNALVQQSFGAISTRFSQVPVENDLSAGVQGGFGLIGYKGKVWSIRYRGEETPLMRPDGDGPRGSIEVAILKASNVVSKIWYEVGYVEGSTAAPDCFSTNGVAPDPAALKKQHAVCATCPRNQWGSRRVQQGQPPSRGKDCQDSKRLAVAPLNDIKNELYGGPLLLRVPAASLQDMAMFGNKMAQLGYPYFSIGTRIAFDPGEAFPKFLFNAIKPLTDDEADIVNAYRASPDVARILAEDAGHAQPAAQAQPSVASAFEQPPAQPAQVTQPVTPQVVQPQVVQPQPVAQPVAQVAQPVVAGASGFGGPEVATQPVQQPAQVAPVMTAPAPTLDAADMDFEAQLDAQLAALLPPAS